MSKPRLLDLFCGAGGAAMGYSLRNSVKICGVTVGLEQSRHRLFECGGWMPLVYQCQCRGREFKGVYGQKPDGRWIRRKSDGTRSNFIVSSIEEGRELLGIDWMEWDELKEAVPPAYTEFIGTQLMAHLKANLDPGADEFGVGTEAWLQGAESGL